MRKTFVMGRNKDVTRDVLDRLRRVGEPIGITVTSTEAPDERTEDIPEEGDVFWVRPQDVNQLAADLADHGIHIVYLYDNTHDATHEFDEYDEFEQNVIDRSQRIIDGQEEGPLSMPENVYVIDLTADNDEDRTCRIQEILSLHTLHRRLAAMIEAKQVAEERGFADVIEMTFVEKDGSHRKDFVKIDFYIQYLVSSVIRAKRAETTSAFTEEVLAILSDPSISQMVL